MPARRGKREMESQTVTQTITSRREQYLVGRKPGRAAPGVEPPDLNAFKAALERDPGITIKKALAGIIVAEMPRERAEELSRLSHLVVEADYPLALADPVIPLIRDPGVLLSPGAGPTLTISVTGKGQAPVEGAHVFLLGSGWPSQAVTDADGQARVTLFDQSADSVRGLYIKPRADYWSFWIPEPVLDPSRPNLVALTPLDQTFPDFPAQEVVGWGLKAMRVHQVPASYRGHGVKVAIVDSGLAASHSDLRSVAKRGYDGLAGDSHGWERDEIGHGSHAAGIIAGLDDGKGIRGIAPDAELLAIKIFPGGRLSNLVEALDRCIELQVDLINLGFGCAQYSELLDEKLREVKEQGIACIVAAGNSAGPVEFPAASPHVLAVAAVGKHGEFPDGSYHATEIWEGSVAGSDGYFSAGFTCFGPEIDLCAPGVAVLSSVPPNNYAVRDGTSVAAPHVTGMAALVLAHHPDFQGPFRSRNAARVERLFQILRQSARPLDLGDQNRTGAGMPDAVNALVLPGSEARGGRADELLQKLLGVLQSDPSAPAERLEVVQQILVALQQAGAAPPVAGTPPAAPDIRLALKQLRGAMQQAGLLSAKRRRGALASKKKGEVAQQPAAAPAGTAGSGPGNGWPMNQLTDAMKYAGLL